MDRLRVTLLTLWLIATISTITGHNITDILSDFPEYSVFNDYLTKTRLDDEINNRQTLTVLVLNNSAVTQFAANQPLSVVKPALSVHILLDYFDIAKLLTIGDGSVTTTTLYQTTGKAAGSTGFVEITDLKGGKVQFRSEANSGSSKNKSLYTKTVKQLPYNISVLEINSPVIALEILPVVVSPLNITSLLEAAGCRTFLKLLTSTGVAETYQQVAADKPLTVFAPTDAAFNATGLPDFNKLTNAELDSLLLYHAIPSYVPQVSLKYEKDPMPTLATSSAGKFALTVQSHAGDSVTLDSGVDNSRVVNMVADSVPVSIITIDGVLLPMELFATPPAPAAAPPPPPSPESSPPSVSTPAPVSTPLASSPAPVTGTSPAPVVGTSPVIPHPAPMVPPTASPADNPTADMGNNNASGGDRIRVPEIFLMVIMVSISGIFLLIAV